MTAAVTTSSQLYLDRDVNHLIQGTDTTYGRIVPIEVKHTVTSGEATTDIVNLCVQPANWKLIGVAIYVTTALSSSAGVGLTLLFKSGSVTIVPATDADVTTNAILQLAPTGINYTPTSDSIITSVYAGTPAKGGVFEGWFFFIPGS